MSDCFDIEVSNTGECFTIDGEYNYSTNDDTQDDYGCFSITPNPKQGTSDILDSIDLAELGVLEVYGIHYSGHVYTYIAYKDIYGDNWLGELIINEIIGFSGGIVKIDFVKSVAGLWALNGAGHLLLAHGRTTNSQSDVYDTSVGGWVDTVANKVGTYELEGYTNTLITGNYSTGGTWDSCDPSGTPTDEKKATLYNTLNDHHQSNSNCFSILTTVDAQLQILTAKDTRFIVAMDNFNRFHLAIDGVLGFNSSGAYSGCNYGYISTGRYIFSDTTLFSPSTASPMIYEEYIIFNTFFNQYIYNKEELLMGLVDGVNPSPTPFKETTFRDITIKDADIAMSVDGTSVVSFSKVKDL